MPKPKASTQPTAQTSSGALTHNPFAKLPPLRAQAKPQAQAVTPATPPGTHPDLRRASEVRPERVRLRQELAGRSGKVVTRISGLPESNLEAIAAQLRGALGCSATIEHPDILLSGSLEARASVWLERAGDLRSIRAPTKPTPTPDAERGGPPAPEAVVCNGTVRSEIRRGQRVAIVLKADQSTGHLTEGIVRDILTNSNVHPRGIKVRLEGGEVGRVKIVFGAMGRETALRDRS